MVESTIDLDMVSHHEFVIKPSFDEGLTREWPTCTYRRLVAYMHSMSFIMVWEYRPLTTRYGLLYVLLCLFYYIQSFENQWMN